MLEMIVLGAWVKVAHKGKKHSRKLIPKTRARRPAVRQQVPMQMNIAGPSLGWVLK